MQENKCVKCSHYFVTYDPAKPHGCRFFGFKSRKEPMLLVYETSGKICPAFSKKRAGIKLTGK